MYYLHYQSGASPTETDTIAKGTLSEVIHELIMCEFHEPVVGDIDATTRKLGLPGTVVAALLSPYNGHVDTIAIVEV
jgi:hypothetical protein